MAVTTGPRDRGRFGVTCDMSHVTCTDDVMTQGTGGEKGFFLWNVKCSLAQVRGWCWERGSGTSSEARCPHPWPSLAPRTSSLTAAQLLTVILPRLALAALDLRGDILAVVTSTEYTGQVHTTSVHLDTEQRNQSFDSFDSRRQCTWWGWGREIGN